MRRYMNCDNNAMPSANPNSSIIKENVFSFNDEMNRIAEWPTTRKSHIFQFLRIEKLSFLEIIVFALAQPYSSLIHKSKEKTFSFIY